MASSDTFARIVPQDEMDTQHRRLRGNPLEREYAHQVKAIELTAERNSDNYRFDESQGHVYGRESPRINAQVMEETHMTGGIPTEGFGLDNFDFDVYINQAFFSTGKPKEIQGDEPLPAHGSGEEQAALVTTQPTGNTMAAGPVDNPQPLAETTHTTELVAPKKTSLSISEDSRKAIIQLEKRRETPRNEGKRQL
ncbi:MAG: hypothetical protein M1812_004633 [Candelaria pacifica]|nr:MAG: hypothetical protein M1812_004633 [Candelaria pacifica]